LPPCPVKDCVNDVVDNKYAVEKNDSAVDKMTMIVMLFIMMQLARKIMHLIVDILLVSLLETVYKLILWVAPFINKTKLKIMYKLTCVVLNIFT
jgi:hypothetical protein